MQANSKEISTLNVADSECMISVADETDKTAGEEITSVFWGKAATLDWSEHRYLDRSRTNPELWWLDGEAQAGSNWWYLVLLVTTGACQTQTFTWEPCSE